MIRLVYVSQATFDLDSAFGHLQALLETSRVFNSRHSITGLLTYRRGIFVQHLEGAASDVRDLYDRICLDSRHRRIIKLLEEPLAARYYPDWSMGYQLLTGVQTGGCGPL